MLNLIFVLACATQAEGDLASTQAATDALAAPATATPVAALPAKPVQPNPVDLPVEPNAEAMPAGADKVQALLLARHNEDLPDKAAIDFHGEGQAILEYLAVTPGSMVVQERALILRGLYEGNSFCVDQAVNAGHPKLQAAAVRCLVGKELSEESLAQVQEMADDADPRIQSAAQAVLAAQP